MALHEQVVSDLRAKIEQKVWLPGDKILSVRAASKHYQLSPMTVLKAYELLEDQGWIHARPKSGYYVNAYLNRLPEPDVSSPVEQSVSIEINDYIFDVLRLSKLPNILPLGSAFPDPELFPLNAIGRSMSSAIRNMDPYSTVMDLPPGNEALRRSIAQRYLKEGMDVQPQDIVITSGAMDALGLSLQAVTQPGDLVAIESPAFYGALQAIERLGLKAIEIPTHPRQGMCMDSLSQVLNKHPVKAVWLMSNFQNPMGFSLTNENKQRLISLLAEHQIPAIEDDVYAELYFGAEKQKPLKHFDSDSHVLHCSSFSKCLAPGFRIGWVLAGKYAQRIERLQLMSTLSVSVPSQLALANFIQHGGYDAHLRRLRKNLQQRQSKVLAEIEQIFPSGTKITRPAGGYFLWLEFPKQVDTNLVLHEMLSESASIAPGSMFATDEKYQHCLRINCSFEWDEKCQVALKKLKSAVEKQLL
ncbi:PLP-dependent aminotransferase family protein [Vibrio sp. Of7-15]|uniref:aminotransferase-like domain-containing protein n=1 Tax=Vibrio sp. Of7-15 TaxID=2724879 RepID=UPI001EF233C9|nr:PLP-dependent aminotransferase family protein [Vibrio sp. Of7-15]MCG7495251.1 PLP-dependent aminotransferase family protein [Vibrio sp. Of7-15]